MKISVITLFPEMFSGPFEYSIIKRAIDRKIVEIEYINIRNFGIGKHKIVDDKPYGGGVGMLLKVDVLEKAIFKAKCAKGKKCKEKTILLDASGKLFKQKKAKALTKIDHLILICAHYEGVDERVRKFVDEEISIGDYILTGGEIPAMVVIDTVVRLLKNVLGKDESSQQESFNPILEYPQYTRPSIHKGQKVPQVLLLGNHEKIKNWREEKALKKTKKLRPDLLENSKRTRI